MSVSSRTAVFPRFQISAGVGFQAFEPGYLFSTPEGITYSVLGGLLAPLVNRSGIEADFAAARAHQIEALVQYPEGDRERRGSGKRPRADRARRRSRCLSSRAARSVELAVEALLVGLGRRSESVPPGCVEDV